MRKAELIALAIVLLSFIVSVYFYPLMPEKIASHWNAAGEVNGFMPKFWGLFLFPLISVILLVLFMLIPRIDPLKENIEKFRKYFDGLIVLLFLFLFYIFLLSIYWNLGNTFDMTQFMMPALAVLFYYMGILIENSKRNWFIGIRTPWTLSNENVWNKTHKLGGKLFKITGVIAFFWIFFGKYSIYFVLVPVILVAFYTIVYSYFEFKKETSN